MQDIYALGGLFLAAFVAATLLPAQSELVLTGLLAAGTHNPAILIALASAGNVLGSAVNWALGRYCMRFADRPWFPLSPASIAKGERWYKKYGRWSLLLSWAPFIGDPITLVAGLLKEPFPSFLFLVIIAKAGRYLVLAALVLHWL